MQKHKNLLLFLAAILLLSAALYFYRYEETLPVSGPGAFPLSADVDVSMMILTDPAGNQIKIEKQNSGVWLLNDSLDADEYLIREALFTLRRMELRGPVPFDDRDKAREVLQENGVLLDVYTSSPLITLPGRVELFSRNRKFRSVLLGSDLPKTGDHLVMHQADPVPYFVKLPDDIISLNQIFPSNPHSWRSRVLIHYEPGEIRKVVVRHKENPTESFHLIVDTTTFNLADSKGLPVDTSQISIQHIGRFLNGFRYLFFERAVPVEAGSVPDDLRSEKPFIEIEIEDIYGEGTSLLFFRRRIPEDGTLVSDNKPYDPNRFYIQKQDDLYLLSLYYIFQPVMRPLSYFFLKPENN